MCGHEVVANRTNLSKVNGELLASVGFYLKRNLIENLKYSKFATFDPDKHQVRRHIEAPVNALILSFSTHRHVVRNV